MNRKRAVGVLVVAFSLFIVGAVWAQVGDPILDAILQDHEERITALEEIHGITTTTTTTSTTTTTTTAPPTTTTTTEAPTTTTTSTVPPAVNLPGVVQAEDYTSYADTNNVSNLGGGCRDEGVDMKPSLPGSEGCVVGWFAAGEWLEWELTAEAGTYDFAVKLFSADPGALAFEVDGVQGETLAVPLTNGSWDEDPNWTELIFPAVTLPDGPVRVRLWSIAGWQDVDLFTVREATSPPPTTTTTTTTTTPPPTTTTTTTTLPTPGDTVIIPAGIHMNYSVVPLPGTTYQCEPGAVLDGGGTTAHAFSGDADNVSIVGCEIRNYVNPPQFGAVNGVNGAHDWYVANNDIHDNWGVGVFISGDRPRVINNHIHHQHQLGIALNYADDGLVQGNEINHNNWLVEFDWGWEAGGSKFWATNNLVLRDNYVHDNHGPGLWSDNDNAGTLYEGNLIEDNCANGIMHEISYSAVIRNNTINRNGSCHAVWYWGPGILISASSDVEAYGNTLNDNYNGITVVSQCRTDNGNDYDAVRNSAHGNIINNSGISGAVSDCGDAVELNFYDNVLTGNSVHVP